MVKITKHFENQLNERCVKPKILTVSDIKEILNRLDGLKLKTGKSLIEVKTFEKSVFIDRDTHGDSLVFIVQKNSDFENPFCKTVVYRRSTTSGTYANENLIRL